MSSTALGWQVQGVPPPLYSGLSPETLLSLLLCPAPDWSFSQLHKISILPAIWMPAERIERCLEDTFGIWCPTRGGDSTQQIFFTLSHTHINSSLSALTCIFLCLSSWCLRISFLLSCCCFCCSSMFSRTSRYVWIFCKYSICRSSSTFESSRTWESFWGLQIYGINHCQCGHKHTVLLTPLQCFLQ